MPMFIYTKTRNANALVMPWRRALLAKMQIVAGTHEIYPRQRLLVEWMSAAAAEDFERVECEIHFCGLWKFIVIYNNYIIHF